MVFRDIGDALRHQPVDHRPHALDMLGGARLAVGLQAAQRLHVGLELRVGRLGDLADRLVEREIGVVARRPRVDLVVDVGDVADIGDMVRAVEVAQQAVEHVEDDDRARIADMGVVVHRRPAHIHAHVLRIDRSEKLLLARQRVVEPKLPDGFRHKLSLAGWPGRFLVSVGRTKTAGPAKALADNADADNGERRFHRPLYRAPPRRRQESAGAGARCFGVARMQHAPDNRILLNMSSKTAPKLIEMPAPGHRFDPFGTHLMGHVQQRQRGA